MPRLTSLLVSLSLALGGVAGCDKKDPRAGGATAERAADKVPETREGQSWLLGQKLALAAVGQANGAERAVVTDSFRYATAIADVILEMKIDPLPAPTGDFAKDGADVMHYLLDGPGRTLGEAVHDKFGPQSGASYELALKLTMLSLLYIADRDDPMADTMADVLDKLRARAGLPPELLAPLIAKLRARAPSEEVMDLAIQLHKDIPAALERIHGKAG